METPGYYNTRSFNEKSVTRQLSCACFSQLHPPDPPCPPCKAMAEIMWVTALCVFSLPAVMKKSEDGVQVTHG